MEWAYIVHQTHRRALRREQSRRVFAEWIEALRRLQKPKGSSVSWFAAFEKGRNGREHVHALIHGPWTAQELRGSWRSGISEVEDYDSTRGGAYYVAKVAADQDGDFDLSDELPPVREETATLSELRQATMKELTKKRPDAKAPMPRGMAQPAPKRHFSTMLDSKLLRELRIAAAEDETTIARITAQAVRRFLRRRAKQQRGPERVQGQRSPRES